MSSAMAMLPSTRVALEESPPSHGINRKKTLVATEPHGFELSHKTDLVRILVILCSLIPELLIPIGHNEIPSPSRFEDRLQSRETRFNSSC